MTFKTKFATGLATAGLLATLVTQSAFAATTVHVKNNLEGSTNKVKVKNVTTHTVVQTNASLIVNAVKSSAKTGGNEIEDTSGAGDATVKSGNAKSNVNLTNGGSSNEAVAPDCGCDTGDTNVTISGNGKNSTNKVKVKNKTENTVVQSNETAMINLVSSSANSGGNEIEDTTGAGDKKVTSGDATSHVVITNTGSTNTL